MAPSSTVEDDADDTMHDKPSKERRLEIPAPFSSGQVVFAAAVFEIISGIASTIMLDAWMRIAVGVFIVLTAIFTAGRQRWWRPVLAVSLGIVGVTNCCLGYAQVRDNSLRAERAACHDLDTAITTMTSFAYNSVERDGLRTKFQGAAWNLVLDAVKQAERSALLVENQDYRTHISTMRAEWTALSDLGRAAPSGIDHYNEGIDGAISAIDVCKQDGLWEQPAKQRVERNQACQYVLKVSTLFGDNPLPKKDREVQIIFALGHIIQAAFVGDFEVDREFRESLYSWALLMDNAMQTADLATAEPLMVEHEKLIEWCHSEGVRLPATPM